MVQEHINDFHKGLRQATLFNSKMIIDYPHYDVNEDAFEGQLLDEEKIETTKTTYLSKR